MRRVFRWCAEWIKRNPRSFLILLIAFLACISGGAAFIQQRSSAVEEKLNKAERTLSDHDFAAARDQLTGFLRTYPANARGHFLLAQTCRQAPDEDFELAETHLKEAYGRGLSPAECDLEIALLGFQSTGERGELETALKSYLETRPDREPQLLEALARGCIRSGRMNTANSWLDRWVKNHPQDWYARLWRGALFQHMGQAPLAVEDYRQLLRLRPEMREVRRRLGLVLVASGYDFQEAKGYLEDALKDQPGDPDTLVALARCHQVLRQPEKARVLLEQALAKQPEHPEGLISLALVEIDLQHDDGALDALQQLEPLVTRFDSREAQERLLRLDPVAYYPHSTERQEKLLHLKGTVLRRLGREEEARTCQVELQQLRENNSALSRAMQERKERPNDPDLLCQIGELQMKLGQKEEGVDWLLQAVRANPVHQRAHQALAEYYESLDSPQAKQRAAEHRRLAKGKT